MDEKKKLHLGCGKRYLPGYMHVDLEDFPHIDFRTSIDKLDMFETSTCDEVYASHALEYFDAQDGLIVLKEWHRVLKPGGVVRLSVPNFDSLISIYTSSMDIGTIIGPLFGRMPLGADKIYHKTVYTREKLCASLASAGFVNFSNWDTFQVFPDFDDHSKAFFPHFDRDGVQVSLNIQGLKP